MALCNSYRSNCVFNDFTLLSILMKKLIYIAVVGLLVLIDISASAQCAMCKSSVTSNLEGGGNTGRGINTGILYLMAIPYLLIGALMAYVFRKQIMTKYKQVKAQYFSA